MVWQCAWLWLWLWRLQIVGNEDGTIRGVAALGSYFEKALLKFPDLHFTLFHAVPSVSSIALYYKVSSMRLLQQMKFTVSQYRHKSSTVDIPCGNILHVRFATVTSLNCPFVASELVECPPVALCCAERE